MMPHTATSDVQEAGGRAVFFRVEGRPIGIRQAPDVKSTRTGETVDPGDIVRVSQVVAGKGRQRYLLLADGRGWVFTTTPGGTHLASEVAPDSVLTLHITWAMSGERVLPSMAVPKTWTVRRLCAEICQKTGIGPMVQRLLANGRRLALDEVLATVLPGGEEMHTLSLIQLHIADHPMSKAFDAGYGHIAAIQPEGSLRCWGRDVEGQSTVPQDLGPVTAVALGSFHTCALKRDGTVACWGTNANGESTAPPGLGEVTAIAAGGWHTCAIRRGGSLACWAFDAEGKNIAPADLGPVLAVAAGGAHTCAIKADGAVACWGTNVYDQCAVPEDLGEAVAVAAGDMHTCAVRRDGRLVCWGRNGFGSCTPPADLGPVLAVAAGSYHTCAVKADGSVACWGCNNAGQCTPPPDLGPVLAVAAGHYHTLAVKADGTLVCWGARPEFAGDGQGVVPSHLGPVTAALA